MATTTPAWGADDLPVAIFECPDVSLLGDFCESPKITSEQNSTTDDAAGSADKAGDLVQPLRVGYAESVILRFASVPKGYDTATSTEKAVANAKQRLAGLSNLTTAHVHQELGFCRVALRDFEPGVERRTETMSQGKAYSLQRQHENNGGVVGNLPALFFCPLLTIHNLNVARL